jgi:putative redox protein
VIRSSSLEYPYQTLFTNGRHSTIADVPSAKGGGDKGFGPHELLEAAFATCATMTVQMHAAKHKLPLQGATCEVHLDRSVPNDFRMDYSLTLDGPLTAEQVNQLHEAARNCPVGRTLSNAISLRPTRG